MRDAGEVLQRTFDAILAQLDTDQVPPKRYLAVGEVAYDCEQFVVVSGPIFLGTPGRPGAMIRGVVQTAINVEIHIVREASALDERGGLPDADSLTEMALQATLDASNLNDAFFASEADGSLSDRCDDIYYGGTTWVGPEGGMLATVLTLSFPLT